MTVDRDGIRQWATSEHGLRAASDRRASEVLALLAELEQAERERDDLIEGDHEKALLIGSQAARLAKVPALVAGLETIAEARQTTGVPLKDSLAGCAELARSALAAWEAE